MKSFSPHDLFKNKRRILVFVIATAGFILLGLLLFLLLFFLLRHSESSFIRVNTVGYGSYESKTAVYMTDHKVGSTYGFEILDSDDNLVYDSSIDVDTVSEWNSKYRTYTLNFTSVQSEGDFYIRVKRSNKIIATSPQFTIRTSLSEIFQASLNHSLLFFQVQRDGADVDGSVLDRQPSHLVDAEATIYEDPEYDDDQLSSTMESKGLPTVDVSGGWADAGDYLKFVETASYVVEMMLLSYRDYGDSLPSETANDLLIESQFGLDWLAKMWNPTRSSLYYQVGLGNGNGDTINGDHDLWRLPQDDDKMNVSLGDLNYFVKFRPVFETSAGNSANATLSPNLAGRMVSSFALCYQIFQSINASYASDCLQIAIDIFPLAQVSPAPSTLVSASPFDFYPEDQWMDDMELASVQLFLATKDISYLKTASYWANELINSNSSEPINLYDTSELAHYELIKVMRANYSDATYLISIEEILQSMASLVDQRVSNSDSDPFFSGEIYGLSYDLVPHAFGSLLVASFYDELTESDTYDDFAIHQRDWIFGMNAWGASFVIGSGSSFPYCPQHQLVGSLDGGNNILYGGVVDGPSGVGNFDGLDSIDEARQCPSDGNDLFSVFTGQGVRYEDNVAAWPSVEPADDYSVIALYTFARLSSKYNL